jgi:hypothetical protein
MTRGQIERIGRIGYGDYRTPPTVEDVPLVLEALADPSGEGGNRACLAVEKMACQDLFDAPGALAALRALLPMLRSPSHDTSEWSARAIGALARYTPFVTGELLAAAFVEMLGMVGEGEPESRRRGLCLAARLLPLLGPGEREQTLQATVSACRREIVCEADGRAYDIGIRTLGTAGRLTEGEGPAADAARELLRAVEGKQAPYYETVLPDLASLGARVGEPLRGRIVRAAIVAASEPRYLYSHGSMRHSPTCHAGADALAVVALLLDWQQLDEAERALPPPGEPWRAAAYGAARKALAERREALARR